MEKYTDETYLNKICFAIGRIQLKKKPFKQLAEGYRFDARYCDDCGEKQHLQKTSIHGMKSEFWQILSHIDGFMEFRS